MGRVWVKGAELKDGHITRMRVGIANLPDRVLDRDTVIHWMRDMHSFVSEQGVALQLVELDDARFAVRTDNQAIAEDALPGIPPLS